jgi:hypothetical protein
MAARNGNGNGNGNGNESVGSNNDSGCKKVYRDVWIQPLNEEKEWKDLNDINVDTICKIQNYFKEMFWVKVIAINKDKDYVIGEVLNKLVYPSIYNRGDLVLFSLNDIWKVQTPESEMIATFNEMFKFYNKFKRVPNNLESILLNIEFISSSNKKSKK